MERLKVPARVVGEPVVISVQKRNRWGYALKIALRNACRSDELYSLPIETVPVVTGKSDLTGEIIPIDTLGKWVFGVPGYRGHIRVNGDMDDELTVELPAGAPSEAFALVERGLKKLK